MKRKYNDESRKKHIISTDSITIADDITQQNLTVFNRSQNISKEGHAVDT